MKKEKSEPVIFRIEEIPNLPEIIWNASGGYQNNKWDKFIRKNYQYRIASWSKVLAFADSAKYAIYDARVVMSLNTILDDTRYQQRFYMPPPSSEKLPKSFSNIKKHVKNLYPNKQPKYLGYFEYLNLLNAIVNKKLANNILEVEMCLFANGMDFAKKYAAKYGLVH